MGITRLCEFISIHTVIRSPSHLICLLAWLVEFSSIVRPSLDYFGFEESRLTTLSHEIFE